MDKIKTILKQLFVIIVVSFIPSTLTGLYFYNNGYKTGINVEPEKKLMTTCDRISPYEMEKPLIESLDKFIETYKNSTTIEQKEKDFYISMKNCIYLEYKDLDSGILGTFTPRYSNLQKLSISIDTRFKESGYGLWDRVFIVAHEATHAKQYYEYYRVGFNKLPIDKEVEAFRQEWKFFTSLDQKTKETLSKSASSSSDNSVSRNIAAFFRWDNKAKDICKGYSDECYWKEIDVVIRKELIEERGYPDDVAK